MNDVTDVPDLRARVAAVLDLPVEAVSEDGNLIEMGIDSIDMMRLASEWCRQGCESTSPRWLGGAGRRVAPVRP